jgi:predicted metalloprotease
MKKVLITLLVLLISISFIGCDSKQNSKTSSLSEGQQKSVDNCIEYIRNSSFTSKDHIDTSIIKIESATENTWKSVWSKDSKIEEKTIDLTDWIITIGNTSGHNFAIIVCDSNNYKVIGYIPID